MDKKLTISISRRSLKIALILAVVMTVLAPVAVIAAGGTFTDDDDSIFEANIEWLAGAGVTAGCNPPTNDNFCPDDNVSRGQMAAFMQRFAQFLGAEDGIVSNADHAATADSATTADNADTVDGYHANALNRVAYDIDESGSPVTVVGLVDVATIMSVEITAPRGGYITIAGQTGLTRDADTFGGVICEISVDDIDGTPGADILDGSRVSLSAPVANQLQGCSSHAAFSTLFGGTFTVNFDVAVFLDSVDVDQGTLIVEYTPFNGNGTGPLIIILPPIITLGEIADQLAATNPEIAAELPAIKAALAS